MSRDVRCCRRCSLLRMRFSALSRRGYFRQDPRTLRRRNGRRRLLRPRFCVLRLRLFSFCFGGGLAVRDFVQLAMSSAEDGGCATYIMMCVRHDGRLGRGVRVDSGLGSGGNQVDLDGLDVRVYLRRPPRPAGPNSRFLLLAVSDCGNSQQLKPQRTNKG